jgi:hypothetical protein
MGLPRESAHTLCHPLLSCCGGGVGQERLDDVAFSESMQRAATSGGNVIKLVDVKGWKEVGSL